jgi:hypothetical protein
MNPTAFRGAANAGLAIFRTLGNQAAAPLRRMNHVSALPRFGLANFHTQTWMTQARPGSGLNRVKSMPNPLTWGAQKRTEFTLVTAEEFEKLDKANMELIGYHGTAFWVAQAIKDEGVKPEATGKYSGGRSGGGTGIYITDHPKIAVHYGRRACLGEMMAFELDNRLAVLQVWRVKSDTPVRSVDMPASILGNKEKVAEFRKNNPAEEYRLGRTPISPKLAAQGITGKTTLIADPGLASRKFRYVAVLVDVSQLRDAKG